MIEKIRQSLKEIRCFHTANSLDIILKNAQEQEISYLEFLKYLLENELSQREQTRINRYIKAAKFPSIKTFEEFDFRYQHSISKREINEWRSFE